MNTLSDPAAVNTVSNWQQFSISYAFSVSFTSGVFNLNNRLFVETLTRLEPNKRHRFVVFIDEGVLTVQPELLNCIADYAKHHVNRIDLVCEPIVMVSGEKLKSELQFIEQMQQVVYEQHIDRHSYVVAIGGGALLDSVGFVAATSHRGIRHVRIPTTVLSQNDSGVGVKNGVNLFGQKNYLGTFAPPFAVINDYTFILSLPARDKIAGMAEAVKVALIRDTAFFLWLEEHAEELAQFNDIAMQYLIRRCAELHMQQIANGGDPFETGSARPLDFGHWAAHRLETLTHYELRHGEAVAIGIALDTRYSVLSGLLSDGEEERVCRLLEQLGFTLWHDSLETTHVQGELDVIQGIKDFQEHLGGELTITLLKTLGAGIEVHEMQLDWIEQSIFWLKQRISL